MIDREEFPQYFIKPTYYMDTAGMVEWLSCSTHIHKILCSNLTSMTLDKSLTAKLSRMTHSCHINASSVSTLDGRGADTAVRKKKKTVETGCIWILIITAGSPKG